jgi:hypothetical protein
MEERRKRREKEEKKKHKKHKKPKKEKKGKGNLLHVCVKHKGIKLCVELTSNTKRTPSLGNPPSVTTVLTIL